MDQSMSQKFHEDLRKLYQLEKKKQDNMSHLKPCVPTIGIGAQWKHTAAAMKSLHMKASINCVRIYGVTTTSSPRPSVFNGNNKNEMILDQIGRQCNQWSVMWALI